MAGGSVDISAALSSAAVDAVLWVGYPGEAGGDAIANVLFGTVVPAGRMPYTVYSAEYVNQVGWRLRHACVHPQRLCVCAPLRRYPCLR
jgi:hypothetical protein